MVMAIHPEAAMPKKTPRERALETFDAWAVETGYYYDPIITPSKEWGDDIHSAYWRDLVERFAKAIQDAEDAAARTRQGEKE